MKMLVNKEISGTSIIPLKRAHENCNFDHENEKYYLL